MLTNLENCDFLRKYNVRERHVEAYRYLKRFQGMDMLDKFYDVMHTLSFKDVTDDLTAFCHRHGGALV